jgi:hypothetical protein
VLPVCRRRDTHGVRVAHDARDARDTAVALLVRTNGEAAAADADAKVPIEFGIGVSKQNSRGETNAATNATPRRVMGVAKGDGRCEARRAFPLR